MEYVRTAVIRILTYATTRHMTVYKVTEYRNRWAAIRFLSGALAYLPSPNRSEHCDGPPSHLYLPGIMADAVRLSNHLHL